jgi:hypothetical protein
MRLGFAPLGAGIIAVLAVWGCSSGGSTGGFADAGSGSSGTSYGGVGQGGSSTGGTSNGGTAAAGGASGAAGGPSSGGSSGNGGVGGNGGGAGLQPCDPFAPSCASDSKCGIYSDANEQWKTACFPLASAPIAVDGACTQAASGGDDCVAGAVCIYGKCRQYCGGSAASPTCPAAETTCALFDGPVPICLPRCHPLIQDCRTVGEGCFIVRGSAICAPHGQLSSLDSCKHYNDCRMGMQCVPSASLPSCTSTACCTWFCDLSDTDQCPYLAAGASGKSVFSPAQAPPEYRDAGWCTAQ